MQNQAVGILADRLRPPGEENQSGNHEKNRRIRFRHRGKVNQKTGTAHAFPGAELPSCPSRAFRVGNQEPAEILILNESPVQESRRRHGESRSRSRGWLGSRG